LFAVKWGILLDSNIIEEERQQEPVTDIVYITKTGEKYHRDGCQYLRQSQIAISRADAIAQGYTPCSRCNP
jgi:methylphosphotriester-DNA--protein-cysteine methyltransferase